VPLAAGCGSAEATRESVVADTAEKTAAAGSSRIALLVDGKQLGTAAFDYERESGIAEVDGDVQIIYTPKATYTSLGAIRPEAGDKKRWVEYEFSGDSRGPFYPLPGHPSDLLGFLQAASDVEKIDTGEERGVEVTRYRARLDVERALQQLPEGERDTSRQMIRQYWPDAAKAGIPFELAIDGESRLRLVSLTIPEDEALVVEFYDYGVEVDAKPPPADEVVKWEELTRLEPKPK
jgi:hypothetical protein